MAYCTIAPVVKMLNLIWYKMLISVSLASGEPTGTAPLMAPSDLRVSKHWPGVILSWNSNVREEMEMNDVKYVLTYTFLNSTKEVKERCSETEKKISLNLYPGFVAKVKTQLLLSGTRNVIMESNWTEFIYTTPVYIQNLSCVIYNISNLNCTWDIKTEAPEDVQYFLSYRHNKRDYECQLHYKNINKKNTGCHFKEVYFIPPSKIKLNISVKDLRNNLGTHTYYKAFIPQRIEKLNPPNNVSIALENGSIRISWKHPPNIGSSKRSCFIYQVKIKDLKPTETREEEYVYPVHNPMKAYSVQVRAKKKICITNKLWSDWSEPVFINDDNTMETLLHIPVLACVLPVISFGIFLIFICRRYICFSVLFMAIPSPPVKIKTWLDSDEAHWQKEDDPVPKIPDMQIIRDVCVVPLTEKYFNPNEMEMPLKLELATWEDNCHKSIRNKDNLVNLDS
ncbi:interleukin-5 receptor subunit alpha isoform X1 [Alligator mississippiensis]|nr:interleukin-5 receptor subunit alpha isoform X1 [Alligator mississippiensis]